MHRFVIPALLVVGMSTACNKKTEIEEPAIPSAPAGASQEPEFARDYERAAAGLSNAEQSLKAAYDRNKTRPMIWRFKPSSVVSSAIDGPTQLTNESPAALNVDRTITNAIVNMANWIDPLFSRPEYGIEKIEGPLPEEVCFLVALTTLRSLDQTMQTEIQNRAALELASSLARRSNITLDEWTHCPQRQLSSVRFSQVIVDQDSGNEMEIYLDCGGRRCKEGESGSQSHKRERDSESGGAGAGGKNSKEAGTGPQGAGAERPRHFEYTDGPHGGDHYIRPRGGVIPVPPPSPVTGAPQPPLLPPGLVTDADSERVKKLVAKVEALKGPVIEVRKSGKTRPGVVVKEGFGEQATATAQKQLLKLLLSKSASRAFGPLNLIGGRLGEVHFIGWYPEEVAYDEAVRELFAELYRQDATAKQKSYGTAVDLLISPLPPPGPQMIPAR